jgi:hypothetical protein
MISTRCARRRAISSQAISPCLYRLAQTYTVGEEQARSRQFQCTHQRNELVRLDPNPTWCAQQYLGRTRYLLEQAGLMVKSPRRQRSRHIWPEFRTFHFDRFGWMQDVPFQTTEIAIRAAQPKQRLRTERRHLQHIPGQTARADAASHREFLVHLDTVGSQRRRNVAAEG